MSGSRSVADICEARNENREANDRLPFLFQVLVSDCGNTEKSLSDGTVYDDIALVGPPADSARRSRSGRYSAIPGGPVIALILLSAHFCPSACGLVILNFKCDLRFHRLFRFEQIFNCGRATNMVCTLRRADLPLIRSSWPGAGRELLRSRLPGI